MAPAALFASTPSVAAQRAWNAWKSILISIDELESPHFHQPPGAPRPIMHAWVRASRAPRQLLQDAELSSPPEMIRVCVLKCRTMAKAYDALLSRVVVPR
jgi:hypothetical protein